MAEELKSGSDRNPQPPKPYSPPRLIVHGTIGALTNGAKAGSSDIGGLTATGL